MKNVKRFIRDLLRKTGFDVRPLGTTVNGCAPFHDIKFFLKDVECPTIFDIGANLGQSVDHFRETLQNPIIHSFEPSPATYAKLSTRCRCMPGVKTWNYGVGSCKATLPFTENICSDMSSFLEPGESCWGKVEKVTNVEVLTLDSFVKEQGVEYVHVLKSDTQGYDFEVFKGAEELMNEERIGLIYFEFIFSDMYKNLPAFHEVFRFLTAHRFSLVSFYKSHFQQDLVSWADALFINASYNKRRLEQSRLG